MLARILVHLRREPGAVVATSIDFTDISYGAGSLEAARAGLAPLVAARLRALEPIDRLLYNEAPSAELDRVPVEIRVSGKGGEPVWVKVPIVVITRQVAGETVYVVRAPAAAGWEVVLHDKARIQSHTASSLAARMKRWTVANLAAADEAGESWLEEIEVVVAEGAALDPEESDEDDLLAQLGTDLVARAASGRVSRFDGREEIVAQVLQTISQPGRKCVLLVGPSAVGKTALVHEIAARIASGDVPEALRGRRLWRISANELIANARYTGMWQDRAQRLVALARDSGVICAMDDPIGIVDAGSWAESSNNVGRFLRPHMESGDICIVCEATPEQFEAARKKEQSFIDAFQRINVDEPSLEETNVIVDAAARRIVEAYGTRIDATAPPAAVALTRRFEPYRSFPGKAIQLLDDTARASTGEIDAVDVTAMLARRSGMPLALISDDVELDMRTVFSHFQARVLGQSEAVSTMCDLVAVVKSALNDPSKPLGSFFFVGPTGVGKTELAKALAELLFGGRDRLLRFDMAEYAAGDAIQRLIGSPWGAEGELTRAVRAQPFCVVLLDEIEKAHWAVFDALLAALGEGRLTDASGRTADFRNAIVIMTSNLGATKSRSSALGFLPAGSDEGERLTRHYEDEAEKFFRPEFFNRIDRIVVFQPLAEETIRQIARREVGRLLLREGIVRRRLLVEVDDPVVDHLATAGFHPQYGARPLHRAIEQAVIQPLARLIVTQSPAAGDLARIHLKDGAVAVELEQVKVVEPPAEAKRERRAARAFGSLARATRAAREFVEQLDAEEATGVVGDLRDEVSSLVDETHAPTFWDDPDSAREVLSRIYRVEHVLDRLDGLQRRASGLVEMASRVQAARDRKRVAEIYAAIEEMEDALLVMRLELAGASTNGAGTASVIRVTPIGGCDDWAAELLAMYAAWAERTARDVVEGAGHNALRIEGLSTHELLRGEAGIHRRVRPQQAAELARVTVGDEGDDGDDGGLVVRVYEEGRRRVVRDPRTRTRTADLDAVLREGRIDAFLLAMLKLRASEATPRLAERASQADAPESP